MEDPQSLIEMFVTIGVLSLGGSVGIKRLLRRVDWLINRQQNASMRLRRIEKHLGFDVEDTESFRLHDSFPPGF